jgi:hypothetical protein
MDKLNKRKLLRYGLMVILVINFFALIIALTNLIEDNPLRDYRIALVVSFVAIAALARQVCKNCRDETD